MGCHEATLGAFNSRGPELEGATSFVEDLKDPEWVQKHRVSPEQVLLHAALHRMEGPLEADRLSLTGYDNARIWYGRLDPRFQVLEDLVEFAKKQAPKVAARCIVPEGLVHVRKVPVRTPGVQDEAVGVSWSWAYGLSRIRHLGSIRVHRSLQGDPRSRGEQWRS